MCVFPAKVMGVEENSVFVVCKNSAAGGDN